MTVPARRKDLQSVPFWPQFAPHAGLWFDKYLQGQKDDTLEPYVEHIRQTGEIKEPSGYKEFFTRWRDELEKARAVLYEAQVIGRLAAGLGGETVIETGLTLHHTYGVPYIPGSSLKGAARAYASANLTGAWAENSAAFRTLFGGLAISSGQAPQEKARAGIAIFHDALPLPGSFTIYNDVMTVHHPDYYQGKDSPPSDWDSPTPIPFSSVNGRFLIAVYASSAPEWAEAAMDILKMALTERGVGGKTSSGYGRFNLTEPPLTAEEQVIQDFSKDLEALSSSQVAGQINSFITRWRDVELEYQYKQQMAQAILDKVEAAGRTKKSSEKAWYQELIRFVASDTK